MKTIICKVIAQSETMSVQSKRSENGQMAKCNIRLRELGGDYEDEYYCTMLGNLARCRFAENQVVTATLRFSCHEVNGVFYQDIVVKDIVVINQ